MRLKSGENQRNHAEITKRDGRIRLWSRSNPHQNGDTQLKKRPVRRYTVRRYTTQTHGNNFGNPLAGYRIIGRSTTFGQACNNSGKNALDLTANIAHVGVIWTGVDGVGNDIIGYSPLVVQRHLQNFSAVEFRGIPATLPRNPFQTDALRNIDIDDGVASAVQTRFE